MPRALINGVELFHDEIGSGPPLILHHGYTGSHDAWLNLIAPRLADRYRCIVMDARGAGESAHPEGGYSFEQYALDVVGMADHLGLDRFTYVGHSMGGGIGMQLGLEHADRLDKLVLLTAIPSGGITADPAVHAEQIAERARPDAFDRMLPLRKLMRVRDVSDEQVASSLRRALSVSQGHYEDSWQAMANFNVTARLGELTTPTLVIAAAADGLSDSNIRDYLLMPNATLHVFSRVSHGVPTDVPDELAAVLADFFEHGVVNAKTEAARVAAATAPVGAR
jgi:pimeloyl-ACP methyl ester carboxylesterase